MYNKNYNSKAFSDKSGWRGFVGNVALQNNRFIFPSKSLLEGASMRTGHQLLRGNIKKLVFKNRKKILLL